MKCKCCGQELTNEMKFCGKCGSPIEQVQIVHGQCVDNGDMLLVTTDYIPNYKIVHSMGLVNATWAQIAAKRSGLFEAIDAFSGNLGADSYITYVEEKCCELAVNRIKEIAMKNNCNAIIGIRFLSHLSEGVLRVTVYGTACVVEKIV